MKRRIIPWALAVLILLTACGGGESWEEQYDLGVRYLSEGNYEEAILAFTAAIEIDPQRPEAYVGRGDAAVRSGETAETLAAALADYQAALDLDEGLAAAWLGLADISIRQGEYDKALELLREGLEKTGGDPGIAGKLAEIEGGMFADSSGQLRRENWYGEGGALTCFYTYTYDDQGRMASITSFDGAGSQLDHIENVYDQEGLLVTGLGTTSSDGRMQLGEYGYDAAGNQIQVTYHVSASIESAVERQYRYTYDSGGNAIREDYYDGTGTMRDYEIYTYTDGQMTRADSYGPDGTPTGYDLYEYNEAGQLLKRSDYDADGELIYFYVYTYDEHGNNISYASYDGDGTQISYSTYQ